MLFLNSVSINKADKHNESFSGYAWLTENGERLVHSFIEGEFKIKKVAGEERVFIVSVFMDGEGPLGPMNVNMTQVEAELEKELQLY